MNENDIAKEKEVLRKQIEAIAPSPEFFMAMNAKIDVFVMHHAGFWTPEEMTLLGAMVKYAALTFKSVHVVGQQENGK